MIVGVGSEIVPPVIDPLAPLIDGTYQDALVTVIAHDTVLPVTETKVVRTRNFELWRHDWRLVLRHRVAECLIEDSLTDLINEELFRPGWVSGSAVFESIFTGVVLTSKPDPLDAWVLFYRNTIARYPSVGTPPPSDPVAAHQHGLLNFVSLHRHADALVPDRASVLEVGACFGFLSLYLARLPGRTVLASDISRGTVGLLSAVSRRLGVDLETFVADAARIPRPDNSVDVVLLIHLLEHLEPRHGRQAVDEALRVASRRVVIAVPYETEATQAYGHVRTIDRDDLQAWGAQARGWDWRVEDHHGGWLVLDRR